MSAAPAQLSAMPRATLGQAPRAIARPHKSRTRLACFEQGRILTIRILAALLLLCTPALAHAQTPSELRTAHAFTRAAQSGPLTLHAFLERMPKGADLHMHLSGAVYAETFLDEAATDGLCVNTAKLSFDRTAPRFTCRPGEITGPAALERDNHLRDALIDAFSMRGFVPSAGLTGHDQFFSTFVRFGGLGSTHTGDWLDEVATRAARQNEQYLEVMDTPDLKPAEALAEKLGFDPDFLRYRTALLAAGIDQSIAPARAALDHAEQVRATDEHCSTPSAQPACSVKIRFLFQVLREQPPADVFAQVLFAFELAKADPRVLGLNFVQPEDGFLSMHDYRLHMSMLDALHALYPGVHITLHAGELAPGLVPPIGLTFHIRSALDQGHAERIGHGVDLMYEDHPEALLKQMAAQHTLVEINLTSNDVILGITGDNHPLPEYLRAHVPVALSTDDEGVSRIDLTHEFVRAAVTYHLTYPQLKQFARASLEHSFLPGASLWQPTTPENLTTAIPACRTQLGALAPSGACATLVHSSEKASEQWELEHRFQTFEATF
jgi:adenosine deaminase